MLTRTTVVLVTVCTWSANVVGGEEVKGVGPGPALALALMDKLAPELMEREENVGII